LVVAADGQLTALLATARVLRQEKRTTLYTI